MKKKIMMMNKIIKSLFFFTVISLNSFSQGVTLKGHVIRKDYCQFSDLGGYVVKKYNKVYDTYFKLTDYELSFKGRIRGTYKLSDKQVENSNEGIIIHYYGTNNRNLYIVGVRECDNKIQVALFPTDGSSEFLQYTIKLYQPNTYKK